jgi:hypothetical protein
VFRWRGGSGETLGSSAPARGKREVRARLQLAKGGVETAHWEKAVAAMPALKPAGVARCPVPETGLMSLQCSRGGGAPTTS